jgi:antitoxin ParD1/3/4
LSDLQALFLEIPQEIARRLNAARRDMVFAVAWFTDQAGQPEVLPRQGGRGRPRWDGSMEISSKVYYHRTRRYRPMPNVEKLSIALTPEMAGLVRRAVESGEYATTSEVVREALREWKQRRTLQQRNIEELRQLWAEGLASGPGRFQDMDAIKAEARRRWDEQHLPQ